MGYKQYEPETLKKIQGKELEIIKEFVRICEKYEIPYFAVFGTAIGAIRHHGFIPWDDDVDFGMLREDYERFLWLRIRSWETAMGWRDRIVRRNSIIS